MESHTSPSSPAATSPAIDSKSTALSIESLSHQYPKKNTATICEISLSVRKGQVCCLLGPSGCGKSTLLRIIAGLEDASRGQIQIFGTTVNHDRQIIVGAEQRKIGMVFQEPSLFPNITVGDNILLAMRHIKKKQRGARLEELMIKTGISPLIDALPHEISGGEQQRVALARALAFDPQIILMDEPFSHLDLRLREQIRDNALHLLKQTNATVVMVTHDPEEAMYIADTIALMTPDGRIAQHGEPATLYYKPCNAYVAEFFGEVNRITGSIKDNQFISAFGCMPCSASLDHGKTAEDVTLIVRPEALQLIPSHELEVKPGIGRVMTARFQGRSSFIHMSSISETGQPLHLHAKVPGYYLPATGTLHHITFDRSLSFLFS